MDRHLTPRVVALFCWAAAGMPLVALVIFMAAYRFDVGRLADLPSIVGDRNASTTLRWAGLADLLAYLPIAPIVVYLHRRLSDRAPDLIGLLTFGGLAYVLLGSLGGTVFATVGPPLVEDGSAAARVTICRLRQHGHAHAVGTLELIGLGVWLIGVGWLTTAENRMFGILGVVAGIGSLLSAARSAVTGRSVGDLAGPLDFVIVGLLGLYVPWLVWLGVRLYRERSQ